MDAQIINSLDIKDIVRTTFNSEFYKQVNQLYSTYDGRVFTSIMEADLHRDGKLKPDSKPLDNPTIRFWSREDFDKSEDLSFDEALLEEATISLIKMQDSCKRFDFEFIDSMIDDEVILTRINPDPQIARELLLAIKEFGLKIKSIK